MLQKKEKKPPGNAKNKMKWKTEKNRHWVGYATQGMNNKQLLDSVLTVLVSGREKTLT
jgi:hypothetical protein